MNQCPLTFHQIKQSLRNRDINFTDIAEAMEVSVSFVTAVCKSEKKSQRIAAAIANALDKSIPHVFGNQYSTPAKRGPKDRSARKREITQSLQNNKPVPPPIGINK